MISHKKTSPAIAQYLAAKQQHPNALLFFRMGDFYELFFDDAKQASRSLGIALTSRNKGSDNPVPMAGVPVRAADNYLKRLVQEGHKVAICEQMQDPKEAKGVVERQVVRVLTPGTVTEDNLLQDSCSNFLLALNPTRNALGLAWVELSTGSFMVHQVPNAELQDECSRLDAAEILIPEDNEELSQSLNHSCVSQRSSYDFGLDTATQALLKFFKVGTLDGFGIGELPAAIGAAGALIAYLQETQLAALPHIQKIELYPQGQLMRLDRATRQSLELVDTMRGAGSGTPLLKILDRSRTAMGSRLLRDWLLSPLTDLAQIQLRQELVGELHSNPALVAQVQESLMGILDMQRLTTRISCGRCNARDLVALKSSLQCLPAIQQALQDSQSPGLQELAAQLDCMPELAQRIEACLQDDPPITIKEGGMIRPGFHPELDELLNLSQDSKTWIANYQAKEAQRTGIQNLKVGFNKVFGYYIEITHGNRGIAVPDEYVRKQTTKNSERYITDELKSFETKVLKSDENSRNLQYKLFLELRDEVATHTSKLQDCAGRVAELDVYVSLAMVARENNYCRPKVDDSRRLSIEDGRHPVIEATHAKNSFVPNDTNLDPPQRRTILLTGPNMAGKSTYIRQNALLVLMAQIGSFVPAKAAHVGLVDRIFTRVGAADDISQGASTFMVEMTETANILNNASARSLVILDEVGRGTSTYDGLSLAWAIAEDIVERLGCRCLFATHYHQLTDMAGEGKGVVNQRVAVKEWGEEIVFLHRIEEGGTDKSYGLHVGRLAGLPPSVLTRARIILDKLEEEGEVVKESLAETSDEGKPDGKQLSLFESPKEKVLRELQKLDTDALTPMTALQLLAEWGELLRGKD